MNNELLINSQMTQCQMAEIIHTRRGSLIAHRIRNHHLKFVISH